MAKKRRDRFTFFQLTVWGPVVWGPVVFGILRVPLSKNHFHKGMYSLKIISCPTKNGGSKTHYLPFGAFRPIFRAELLVLGRVFGEIRSVTQCYKSAVRLSTM